MADWEKISETQYVKCVDRMNYAIINIISNDDYITVQFHAICVSDYTLYRIKLIVNNFGYDLQGISLIDSNGKIVPAPHVNQIIAECISEQETIGVHSTYFSTFEEAENHVQESYINKKNLH